MEFQAFLSWFSLIRLLLDGNNRAEKPTARDFCRHGAIAQVAAGLL
jgi:hypothetical protein